MRLAISDLQLLLDYLRKRSTDIGLRVDINGPETRFTFGDVDGQIVTITLYSLEASRIAKITKTENLPVVLSAMAGKS